MPIRDDAGRVLLVNPSYKENWDLPGSMAEANEPPRTAAERELREELSLRIAVGRLLLIDWVGPRDPWDDQLVFIFDDGTLAETEVAALRINDPEITAFEFTEPDIAEKQLRPDVAERLGRSRRALASGTVDYVEMPRR